MYTSGTNKCHFSFQRFPTLTTTLRRKPNAGFEKNTPFELLSNNKACVVGPLILALGFLSGSVKRSSTALCPSRSSGSHTCRNTSCRWATKAKPLLPLLQWRRRRSSLLSPFRATCQSQRRWLLTSQSANTSALTRGRNEPRSWRFRLLS